MCSNVATEVIRSEAYIKAVPENLPKTQIVFDRFHVIKLFNDKLSDLRRELFREATDNTQGRAQRHPLAAA